ncbi:PEP-CTERM sorting domain-containing protein [Oceaniferula spumae]
MKNHLPTILVTTSIPLFTLSAQAAISIVGGAPTNQNDDSNTGHTLYSGITVNTGDVVVIATAANKNFAANQLILEGSGVTNGTLTTISAEEVHASYVFAVEVTTGGTWDYQVTASNNSLTANSSLYILRADAGERLELLDSGTDSGDPVSSMGLTYNFGSSISAGDAIAIEAVTTQSGVLTADADYTERQNGGDKRLTADSLLVNGATWTSEHTLATEDDAVIAGLVVAAVPIPEPSSTALLGLGGLALILRRRK